MEQAAANGFSLENPLFRVYSVYCSILVLKMIFISILTTVTRYKRMAFANPEDASKFDVKAKSDEEVERVRRTHRNDLENTPIFLFVSFIYVLTNPSVHLATTLFRVYTIARITHTVVYLYPGFISPQPIRALSHLGALFIVAYMAVMNMFYFL